ncbi:phosphoribosyltransferase family protein [Flavobacterium dankookense]|uniref:Pyrimidine operon attenuation protein/uracil phosphoribosyltransferase n=1 Tax=Flavobacterium dankookense TaxID=706186 RepID=A0A4R6QEU3_9FLAO|nr:phosphoribosyltransferase family protein [Flavobacterium dankookense]TDP60955.1 pyrimidine operon attenuation protein/uracil phosphoribosyltransferase [Flavobacterium dankookense]
MSQNIILTHEEIEHKTQRIAYQIYETFGDDEELIIAGISKNGFILAENILKKISKIMATKITICEVFIDKQNPLNPVTTSIPKEIYTDKNLVLIDDVLNSGTTLIYGVKHFLEVPIKKFKTVVLVDRNHKKYPVKADFKGISLSTSSKEHVQVVFENNNSYAYLV